MNEQTIKCTDCGKEITVPNDWPTWACVKCSKVRFAADALVTIESAQRVQPPSTSI